MPVAMDGVNEFPAPHLDAEAFRGPRAALRATMDSGLPDYLGYFTVRLGHYVTDRFEAYLPDWAPGVEVLRARTLDLCRHLTFTTGATDVALAGAASGALIRVLVETDDGLLVQNCVVTEHDVLGLRFFRPGGDPAAESAAVDRVCSDLTRDLRGLLKLAPRDPGGFEHPAPRQGAVPDDVTHVVGPDHPAAPAVRRALDVGGLHYAALVSGTRTVCAADAFSAPGLARFRLQAVPEARRAFLGQLAPGLQSLAREYGRAARPVLRGPLRRLVLDVEQGAIIVVPLPASHLLLTVTLDQSAVATADECTADLVRDLAPLVAEAGPASLSGARPRPYPG